MKLEYLENISDGGKFKTVVSDNLVRLYDFDPGQTETFVKKLQEFVVYKTDFNLSKCDFIELVNCSLILSISNVNQGILKTGNQNIFTCYLTEESYLDLINVIQ